MKSERDFDFERFVRKACMKNMLGAYAGIALLFLLGLFFVSFGIAIPFIPVLLLGLLPWGGIALLIIRFKGDLKGEDYWISLLVNHPEKVIWIKPIRVRHTAAYVITLYHEMNFQLLTADGIAIAIKCDSPLDQQIFLRGLKKYVPHAHAGYDERAEDLYRSYRPQFIELLKQEHRYRPVGQLDQGGISTYEQRVSQ